MSWTLDCYGALGDLPERLPEEQCAGVERVNPGGGAQAEAAYALARAVIASGAAGPSRKRFHLGLAGHHNPYGEPVSGRVNDYVAVRVEQLAAEF